MAISRQLLAAFARDLTDPMTFDYASIETAPTVDRPRATDVRDRVLVAMSGGVDSAVAALLLHEQGYDVVGVHMATSPHAATMATAARFNSCCSPRDAADARAVAVRAGFAFYNLNMEAEFHEAVIEPFVADYLAGRTPIPCVHCNNKLKLGTLLDRAATYGALAVATGHYARVGASEQVGGQRVLMRPVDRHKDQTYYLFGLTPPQIERFWCPLGELPKSEVREMARERGLTVHDKPDSQEICFVPDNNYRNFLRGAVPDADDRIRPGDIVDRAGNVIGRHTGTPHYTIGQRKGLGIAAPRPLYVLAIDVENNVIVAGEREELECGGLRAAGVNWQIDLARLPGAQIVAHDNGASVDDGNESVARGRRWRLRARAQIRYQSTAAPCSIEFDEARDTIDVRFDEPQIAITPGQACVLYDDPTGDVMLGGAWITSQL